MGDGTVGGLAVHIGARVAALAGPGQVLVSSTVKDLVAGSGLTFEGWWGEHELKGVPDMWRIYAVSDRADVSGASRRVNREPTSVVIGELPGMASPEAPVVISMLHLSKPIEQRASS